MHGSEKLYLLYIVVQLDIHPDNPDTIVHSSYVMFHCPQPPSPLSLHRWLYFGASSMFFYIHVGRTLAEKNMSKNINQLKNV